MGFSRLCVEDGAAPIEIRLGCRLVDGVFQAQSEFVRNSRERALGQTPRVGEVGLDSVNDAAKPF